jgi:hypothetical protein
MFHHFWCPNQEKTDYEDHTNHSIQTSVPTVKTDGKDLLDDIGFAVFITSSHASNFITSGKFQPTGDCSGHSRIICRRICLANFGQVR